MTTMPTRASYQRGDVLLVKFPNSDLRSMKLRPALVVQASYLDMTIVDEALRYTLDLPLK